MAFCLLSFAFAICTSDNAIFPTFIVTTSPDACRK